MLRLLEAVDDRSLDVAHHDLLLLLDRVLGSSEDVRSLAPNEAELRPENGVTAHRQGRSRVDDELWLSDHAVDVHRRRVREVAGLRVQELARDDVGIAEVFPCSAELKRDEDVQTGPQARRNSTLDELPHEAACGGRLEARYLGDVGQRENAASPLVEHRHRLGRARPESLGR